MKKKQNFGFSLKEVKDQNNSPEKQIETEIERRFGKQSYRTSAKFALTVE